MPAHDNLFKVSYSYSELITPLLGARTEFLSCSWTEICTVQWENLASIKFGNFRQNAIFFHLVSFKSGPQCPNVTSLMQCKPSLTADQDPVACNFKLRGGLDQAFFAGTPSHPCPL